MNNLESEELLKGDERILAEAKRRFTQCEDWEGESRNYELEDIKFAHGDSDNLYQWPDSIRRNREIDDRPCITVNKVRQHNLQIINDARQNKPGMKFRPTGNGATYESAQVLEGIARHIEYISNAQDAYITALKFQVDGGIGYWRVVTDYAGDDSFDQEIFIRRVKDPLTIYIDPDINEKDGSDSRFGFIFDNMPRDEFNEAYPKYKDKGTQSALNNTGGWVDKDHVRVAEYYRRVAKEDRLITFTNPQTGEQVIERISKLPKDLVDAVIDAPDTKQRTITDDKVEWFLIIGDEIAERQDWPGKYIPIVRIIGEETIVDGVLDRKGHTRYMKDSQRNYNYWLSAGVEFIALQSKTPYIAPVAAIEDYETYWNSANKVNHAVLPYNHKDNQNNEIPRPERQEPPVMAPAYISGMEMAERGMMMSSGQYEATFGQKGNEVSGKAINAREHQGDIATAHFNDNFATGIRFTAKIILDLIPKIYDTPRALRILAEDGKESHVQLDPKAQQAYMAEKQEDEEAVQNVLFNPNVGKYDVEADVGPAYGTKREEAFNALSMMMQQNPQIAMIIGDLWADNSDFPTADKIAERFRNLLPPQASGKAPPAEVEQLRAQLKTIHDMNAKLVAQLTEEKMKAKDGGDKNNVDWFKAQTDRMDVIANILEKHVVTPRMQAEMMHDLALQEHQGDVQGNAQQRDFDNQQLNQPKESE